MNRLEEAAAAQVVPLGEIRFSGRSGIDYPACPAPVWAEVPLPEKTKVRVRVSGAFQAERGGDGWFRLRLAAPGAPLATQAEVEPEFAGGPASPEWEPALRSAVLDSLYTWLWARWGEPEVGAVLLEDRVGETDWRAIERGELAGRAARKLVPATLPVDVSASGLRCAGGAAALIYDGVRLVVADPAKNLIEAANQHEFRLATAAALLDQPECAAAPRLSAVERWPVGRDRLAGLEPVLRQAGFDGRPMAWALSQTGGELEACLSVSLPAAAARAWSQAPEESESAYFRVFSRVVLAIQETLRARLPFRYFDPLERYEDVVTAYSMVVYRCSRPHAGWSRTDLVYDSTTAEAALASTRTPRTVMGPELHRIAAMLDASGRRDLARPYRPLHLRDVLPYVSRHPRPFHRLMANEGELVRAFLAYAQAVRQAASSEPCATARQDFLRRLPTLVQPIHARTRPIYASLHYPEIGAILLVEATAALNAALGRECPLTATLRLGTASGARVFTVRRY